MALEFVLVPCLCRSVGCVGVREPGVIFWAARMTRARARMGDKVGIGKSTLNLPHKEQLGEK
jgi:hypothetical protein